MTRNKGFLLSEATYCQGYPNIGIDDRNQFDMLDSLPGGIDSFRQLVNDFQGKIQFELVN